MDKTLGSFLDDLSWIIRDSKGYDDYMSMDLVDISILKEKGVLLTLNDGKEEHVVFVPWE